MSLVITALRTALDRFVRFAPRIIAFAAIVLIVQLVVRGTAALFERFGTIAGIGAGVVAFVIVAYLSFVALRFSYRTLKRPRFDFSLDTRGVIRLMVAESALLILSLPSLILPLALLFSLVDDIPPHIPWFIAIDLPPIIILILAPIALVSLVVLIRLSMTGFRIVVLDEPVRAALIGSWKMTRRAFGALLIYNLVPLVLIFVLTILLLFISIPFAFVDGFGLAIIASATIIISLLYVLAIDPMLAIGKAKLFEELTHKAHKPKG
jgi:hypothetical protein